ncbi:MAG: hypothetical protein OXI22_06055 [Defluviicoccus sp.]|nr:hypothetical protein [Defluviicoccus sp.]MDE0383429.1 hypothetical protein [Defluviicoccus sp.]
MNGEIIALIAVQVAVLGFLWALHRDISSLRERMAKMEGQIDGIRTAVEAFEGQINTLRGLVISRAVGPQTGE